MGMLIRIGKRCNHEIEFKNIWNHPIRSDHYRDCLGISQPASLPPADCWEAHYDNTNSYCDDRGIYIHGIHNRPSPRTHFGNLFRREPGLE